jgi:hypothetical protein
MVDEVPVVLPDICVCFVETEFSWEREYVPWEDPQNQAHELIIPLLQNSFFSSSGRWRSWDHMAQMFAFNDLDVPKVSS